MCSDVVFNYAGVDITYEANNDILRFNSLDEVNTVLNELDEDEEEFNENYEVNYPNATEDNLDSIDEQTGYDEFTIFKQFENHFTCFMSKRSQLEDIENAWLMSDFTTTDPDSLDFTFDDAENTIYNRNYQIKIGQLTYEMRFDGLYNISEDGPVDLVPRGEGCFSNRRVSEPFYNTNQSRKYKLKVAIHSVLFRSSVKGKVVSFKRKNNGGWKRARRDLRIGIAGNLYKSGCIFDEQFSRSKPLSGFQKRKSRKVAFRDFFVTYRTKTLEVGSRFDTPDEFASLILQ